MNLINNIGMATVVAASLVSIHSQADEYFITSGGLTEINSTTLGPGAVTIDPAPTGFDAGVLEIDISGSTVTLVSGSAELSDFVATLQPSGFTPTTVDVVDTLIEVQNGATGTLSGLTVTLTSSGTPPSVTTDANFQNCSGVLCLLIPFLDLDLATYTFDITFSSDFSSFTGVLHGTTANNSTMEIEVQGSL